MLRNSNQFPTRPSIFSNSIQLLLSEQMLEFLLTKVSHSGLNLIVLEASIKTSLTATGDGIYQLNCQKLKRSCLLGIDLQEYFYDFVYTTHYSEYGIQKSLDRPLKTNTVIGYNEINEEY